MIPCLFAFECDQGAITFLLSLMNRNFDLLVDQKYPDLKNSTGGDEGLKLLR